MTNLALLLFGSGIFFVFSAGCYIYVRENWVPNRSETAADARAAVELRVLKSDREVSA